VAKMHGRRLRVGERAFYHHHLAHGGPAETTGGRQPALAEILGTVEAPEFGFEELRVVQKHARTHEDLASALARIEVLEHLIAPAALVFGFLQDRDRQAVTGVARQLAETWGRPLRLDLSGLRALQPEIGLALRSPEEAQLWLDLAHAFTDENYARVVEVLVAVNASVMSRRHGAAAWIAIEGGRLRVRLMDERAELTTVEEAENRWRSTYFINALWRVCREVAA